jgi:hypothetical protein
MARGGMRPTASQNNPMNVNARGGNGQSGNATQAAKYVPDLPYGEGQALVDTQRSAPLAAASGIEQSNTPSGLGSAAASQPIIGLGEKTLNPGQVITAGYDGGNGPDSSILGLMGNKLNEIKDVQMIMKYLPDLDIMYRSSNAPDAFKAWFRTLKGKVDQIMKDQQ